MLYNNMQTCRHVCVSIWPLSRTIAFMQICVFEGNENQVNKYMIQIFFSYFHAPSVLFNPYEIFIYNVLFSYRVFL